MDKITNKKNNILRICAGNDFSIVVQITEYDTEASAWVNYDLSAVSDVHMSLIAENGKHIKLPVTVNSNGTVSAAIQSAYLQKTTYGIEITWLTESLNRRTYSPCLLQIVTSTAESSSNIAEYESNDAYHFNIKMMSDVAILSIGKISDEYITEKELDEALSSYATIASVDTQISTLWNDVNEQFVDNDELASTLASYATLSTLDDYATLSTLDDYATLSTLDDYVTNEQLVSMSYATTNYVDDAVSHIDLTNYYTKTEVDTTLQSYVNDAAYDSTNHNILLKNGSTVIATIDASPFIIDGMVENVQIINDNLVISFNTDAGKQDISIPISQIFDASNYYTKNDIDVTLTSYATTQYVDGEIANIDLSSYVTTDELSNAGYVTAAYVGTYIDSLDSRVTYLEEHQGGGDIDLSAYVTYLDWDNTNEAIAYELTNNRLEHLAINDNFSYYYTKTESDGRYAPQSWANNKFVTQTDDVNRQEAIAAAFSYTVMSDTIHNIWRGSQSDYDLLTPDADTLYIII